MKNVKKIVAGAAALGVGALMITGAFAANVTPEEWTTDFTRGDFFQETGVPSVSVVVGSQAQASDFIWAGNIAAAIGAKSYVAEGEIEGGYTFNNAVVEVGMEGSSVISGDGLLTDGWKLGDDSITETLDDRDYSVLGDYDVDVDDDIFDDDEINIQESIYIAPTVAFDDAAALIVYPSDK